MLACCIVKESVDGVYVNVSYEYIVTWSPDAALSWFRQPLVPACDSPPSCARKTSTRPSELL